MFSALSYLLYSDSSRDLHGTRFQSPHGLPGATMLDHPNDSCRSNGFQAWNGPPDFWDLTVTPKEPLPKSDGDLSFLPAVPRQFKGRAAVARAAVFGRNTRACSLPL